MSVTFALEASTNATINGELIPAVPDLAGLRRDRSVRLRDEMARRDVDALLVLGTSAVHYATGAALPSVDAGRATVLRPVALVLVDDPHPHLFTPYPDGAADRLPEDHVHPPLFVDFDEAVDDIRSVLGGYVEDDMRLAADERTHPLEAAVGERRVANGAAVLAAARLVKTPDELACLRTAQGINEAAMGDVYPLVRPGARQSDLSGTFLRRAFELGATGVGIDPIWQAMPEALDEGPWTTHGDVAYPTPTTDRMLRSGDVLWIDSGVLYEGYASDFGRTWIVGARPTATQHSQFERWLAVLRACLDLVRPGTNGLELCRAARAADPASIAAGRPPWLTHFYLSHGLGVDSAEMPLLGTDLGESFDESIVLTAGVVLVFEPVIWDDGMGGYRSEDTVVVTDDGWAPLSDHPYDPFEPRDGA